MTSRTMTTREVAEYLGIKESSVRKELHRLGIQPVSREPGRAGQNIYDANAIKRAAGARPGKGARTDLAKD